MVDYDLVVIGGSPAGLYAALTASYLKARVALIASPLLGSTWSEASAKYNKVLTYTGRVARIIHDASAFGFDSSGKVEIKFSEAIKWAKGVIATLDENYSPAVLASLGIDVIFGEGEFCRRPHFALMVKDQLLRSRSYLITTGAIPVIPEIDGLQSAGYLTPDSIFSQVNHELPKSLIVIGDDPVGVELAQTFSRLGSQVTLVVSSSHILSKEDSEVALLIQSLLEAEGIKVITGQQVSQVKWLSNQKWIQVGNQAIAADEILIASDLQPNIASLNLEAAKVKVDRYGIRVNQKLQTTHRRIYACGDVLGGYRFAHLANYEALIAVKNMLFAPFFKVDYRYIPIAIFSHPELARIGLTEAQATRRYGDRVLVFRRYFKTVDKAQMRGETTGFCKIITLSSGEILGVHIVGSDASELIHVFALAMQQRLKIKAIANLTHIFPSFSEIISQTASDWQLDRFKQNLSLQNFLEGWFNFLRSWSR